MKKRIPVFALIAIAGASSLGGCGGPPQVSRENRRIVESLATAVSARNADWLRRNVEMIDEARSSGRLADSEDRAFRAILDRARSGDWAGAETLAFSLRDAQRASGQDFAEAPKPTLRQPRSYRGMPQPAGRPGP
jgi:hypothetical protein